MTKSNRPLLVSVLIDPNATRNLDLSQWDLLIRQARRAGVLARLGDSLHNANLLPSVPQQAMKHLRSAQIYAEQFKFSLRWEISCLEKTFDQLDIPLVILKGAAYELAENRAAIGRVFSDVDILVSKNNLARVERAMMRAGWMPGKIDKYDDQYYRKWMHEIPPLTHVIRGTTIDVHHNILPETCRLCPNADKLFEQLEQVENNVFVLSGVDRVLHSATHLFHEGELDHGFRDLSDLDILIKEFSVRTDFWDNLLERSYDLNQQVPLFYALHYCRLILETPIPPEIICKSEKIAVGKFKQTMMDFLFLRALLPDHSSCNDRLTSFARWLLYIRSHWLRMPLHLLIPHLLRKSWKRLSGKRNNKNK